MDIYIERERYRYGSCGGGQAKNKAVVCSLSERVAYILLSVFARPRSKVGQSDLPTKPQGPASGFPQLSLDTQMSIHLGRVQLRL